MTVGGIDMQQELSTKQNFTKNRMNPQKKGFLWKVVQNRMFFPFLIPGVIIILINQYLPIFGILVAFKNINYNDGIFKSPWVGTKNFEFLFATKETWNILFRTVAYNLAFIFIGLIAAVAIAVAVNEIKNRHMSRFYQSAMILPSFLSIVIVSYVVNSMLATRAGVMNTSILPILGIDPIQWYTEPKYWPFILPIVNIWKGAGIGSVYYLSAICGIDEELYQSAVIDGANKWQQIKYITVPFLLPMITIITLLSLGGIIRADFGLFYNVTLNNAMLYPTTDVLDTYVYRALTRMNDVGMSSAASVFQSIAGSILIIAVNLGIKKIDPERSIF